MGISTRLRHNYGYKVIILTILVIATIVRPNESTQIPANKNQVESWFHENVKPAAARKGTLDPVLAEAEAGATIIKVKKDGSGNFKRINDAIKSVPSGNKKRVIIWIGAGDYFEKVIIDKTKQFITLYGEPGKTPRIMWDDTAAELGTFGSATLIALPDYFMAVNLIIVNSSPRPDYKKTKGPQALAMRIDGNKAAFYNCRFIGFQDTLCDDRGFHFFKDCYVEGTVDFIFGRGTSLYLNSEMHVVDDKGLRVITAQGRNSPTDTSGYSFVHCKITGSGTGIYLGRAWMAAPKVVYAYTEMGNVVNPEGWSNNFQPERSKTVFYGEYKCTGPGASTDHRVKYTKKLTDAEAQKFLVLDYIQGSQWLLPPPKV